jgi:hypothetical protein
MTLALNQIALQYIEVGCYLTLAYCAACMFVEESRQGCWNRALLYWRASIAYAFLAAVKAAIL